MEFEFRLVATDDLPTMHRWLNDPAVVTWWEGDDVSWDGVVRDYAPDREPDSQEHYIAALDGEDVGWISCGPVADWPDESIEWSDLGADECVGGIDYLVGDPDRRGQGVGSAMIRAFVRDIAFGEHPDWTQVGADPAEENAGSLGALASIGFRHLGTYGDDDGRWHVMVIDRDEV